MNDQDREQMKLRAAGWEPKERGEETIWKSPDNDFYYAQGVAVAMVREGEDTHVPKGTEGEV